MSAPVVDTPPPKQSVVGGIRPDITVAQILAGIPMLAALLAAFGLYDLSDQQEEALVLAVGWGAALIFGDAGLRAARNSASAKRDAAAIQMAAVVPPQPPVASSVRSTPPV